MDPAAQQVPQMAQTLFLLREPLEGVHDLFHVYNRPPRALLDFVS